MSKKKASRKTGRQQNLRLIVSDEMKPSIPLKPGMKLEVVSVSVVDPALRRSRAVAARLCGGTSTCLAARESKAFCAMGF